MSGRGNVLVGKCPIWEISFQGNIRQGSAIPGSVSGKCQSGNCLHTSGNSVFAIRDITGINSLEIES